MIKICMVPVCYNAHDDAVCFLGSIESAFRACSGVELNVVLCDNSTITPTADFFSHAYSYPFKYLKNENIGYFPAFNKALSALPIEVEAYDYVIVCNVDLVVANDFFSILLSYDLGSDTGLIAPGIFSLKNGRDLNPKMMGRPSALKINFMRVVCSSVILFRLYLKLVRLREMMRSRLRTRKQGFNNVKVNEEVKTMYGAHGSFLIFTKYYFFNTAHVAYPRFLFGEECFVAEQLRMHDLNIKHCKDLIVFDREHASTSKEKLDFICSEHRKSYDFLYKNFFSGKS